MAKKGSGRTFALVAAVFLLISAISLMALGMILFGAASIMGGLSTGLNGTASSVGTTFSAEFGMLGAVAFIVGILYLVSMIGVVQGKYGYGYQLGVVLSVVSIVLVVIEMVMVPLFAFFLAAGVIFPGLTLLFLFLGRTSFK
jgi:hypothetical protein